MFPIRANMIMLIFSYYVKPMWRVNCLKASGAQQELEEAYGDDERNTVAYTQLLVDAQTGEIISQSDAADRIDVSRICIVGRRKKVKNRLKRGRNAPAFAVLERKMEKSGRKKREGFVIRTSSLRHACGVFHRMNPSQTATISNVSLSGRLHPHAAETYTQRLPHRGSLTEGVKKDRHQAVGQYITERRECERRFPANRAARGIRRGKDPPPASESGGR